MPRKPRKPATGLIPAAPIRRLVERWSAEHPDAHEVFGPSAGIILGNTGQIAYLTECSISFIKRLRNRGEEFIQFDTADRIVIALFGGPCGWKLDDEAAAIYASFDLGPLDTWKPCAA